MRRGKHHDFSRFLKKILPARKKAQAREKKKIETRNRLLVQMMNDCCKSLTDSSALHLLRRPPKILDLEPELAFELQTDDDSSLLSYSDPAGAKLPRLLLLLQLLLLPRLAALEADFRLDLNISKSGSKPQIRATLVRAPEFKDQTNVLLSLLFSID